MAQDLCSDNIDAEDVAELLDSHTTQLSSEEGLEALSLQLENAPEEEEMHRRRSHQAVVCEASPRPRVLTTMVCLLRSQCPFQTLLQLPAKVM